MVIKSNVFKCGDVQAIKIPSSILKNLNWSEDEKLELEIQNGEIRIKKIIDLEKRKTIEELFVNHKEEYECEVIDWGNPVGKEIW